MGVETKKMANSIATAGGNFGDQLKSWPERVKTFYNDVRTEMRKVTAPSWKEVQATTAVVVITVFDFWRLFFGHRQRDSRRAFRSCTAISGEVGQRNRAQQVRSLT
jgi:preprotein translocase SecE subunit